jgi:hypothetical protein
MRGIIKACSMSAISFVISFKIEFGRKIGLKSFGVTRFLVLGMTVMKELLIACTFTGPEKKSFQS